MAASNSSAVTTSSGYGSITALYDNVTKILTYNVTWQLNAGATVNNNHFHSPGAVGTAAGGELRGQMIQNPTETGDVYQNNILTLGNVLVPGISGAQSYSADLTFNGSTFSLTRATPVR